MKKKELINIIERLVRNEVKKQVNEIFIKEGKKAFASRSVEKDEISSSLTQIAEQEYTQPKPKKREYKEYTKNKSLNKILNETAGGIPQGDSDYPTMSGGIYDTSRMSEMLGYGNLGGDKETKRKVAAVDTIKKAGVDVDQVPDHVQNALTKDYSKVMKAIDQKKNGGYRP